MDFGFEGRAKNERDFRLKVDDGCIVTRAGPMHHREKGGKEKEKGKGLSLSLSLATGPA